MTGLKADIERQVRGLDRLVGEMQALLERLPGQPTFLEVRAAGSILHDFYTALEKTFSQIALQADGGLPKGEDWHIQLLGRMSSEIPSVRPPVISAEVERELAEYLRFRHVFRNIYGFELRWELLSPLALRLEQTEHRIKLELEAFLAFLAGISEG